MPALSVRGLVRSYGSVRAVDGVSFEVEAGEVFALLGPNGAGKTTTIEILEGFRARDAGEVSVLGIDPSDRRSGRRLRSQLGVVLQELAVEPFLSVRQVLERNAGYYPAPRPVGEVIELVGLAEKADAKVKTLSGGQQRRLDVGLGIVGNPALLFLDEPTTGLDPAGRRSSWELVRRLAGEGTTVILTTHYMEEAEEAGRPSGDHRVGQDRRPRPAGVTWRSRSGCGHDPLPATRRRHARRSARSGPRRWAVR